MKKSSSSNGDQDHLHYLGEQALAATQSKPSPILAAIPHDNHLRQKSPLMQGQSDKGIRGYTRAIHGIKSHSSMRNSLMQNMGNKHLGNAFSFVVAAKRTVVEHVVVLPLPDIIEKNERRKCGAPMMYRVRRGEGWDDWHSRI